MAIDTQKLVVRTGITVEIARYAAGVLGAFAPICPRGTVSVNSQFGTTTYNDFCTALGEIAAMAPDGDRTIAVSFNTYLIPSGTAYQTAQTIHNLAEEFVLRITWDDRQTAGTPDVDAYKGYITSLNKTGNQDGAAEVAISFNASGLYVAGP